MLLFVSEKGIDLKFGSKGLTSVSVEPHALYSNVTFSAGGIGSSTAMSMRNSTREHNY